MIAPDLPGHGELDPPAGDYSLGAHACAMRDLLLSWFSLAGHSLGGRHRSADGLSVPRTRRPADPDWEWRTRFRSEPRLARGNRRRPRFAQPILSIHQRPFDPGDRSQAGRWEGDLIVGKNQGSAIGTLVERQTRLIRLLHLRGRDADSLRAAIAAL